MRGNYSKDQRVWIVTKFLETRSYVQTRRSYETEFGLRSKEGPSLPAIRALVKKFHTTGSVLDMKPIAKRRVRTEDNIQNFRQVFQNSPKKSLRRAARESGVNRNSVNRIVRKDLHMFPYKIQYFEETPLHPLKVTAWCAVTSRRIYGPYWFQQNVNQHNYREMLETKFIPDVLASGVALEDMWFMQDGATKVTALIQC
jgi:hypothetical protein